MTAPTTRIAAPASAPPWRPARGFTLIDTLVTVALVAIVAGMAAVSWHQHIVRGWRAQVRSEMIGAMLRLQRHAEAVGTYAADHGSTVAGRWPQWVPPLPARPRHRIVAGPCPEQTLRECVELRALPTQPDSGCGTLILRSTGEWLALPEADAAPLPRPLPQGC